jgi:hypothetical protein
MLTRREVEVELRSLFLPRLRTRRRSTWAWQLKTRVVAGVGIGLAVLTVYGVGALAMPQRLAPVAVRQWAVWGVEHVSDSSAKAAQIAVFPTERLRRSNGARLRAVREQQRRVLARRAGID